MFENLKSMTDDDVINVINTIVTDNIDVELADLKLILAEASGRKLEKKYINISVTDQNEEILGIHSERALDPEQLSLIHEEYVNKYLSRLVQ